MMATAEEIDIVIVGGGISGLATALALHRKGIKSVVLERSETARSTGAAIGVLANGWRALRQLGLDSTLQSTAIQFQRAVDVWVDKGEEKVTPISEGEARCLRRTDLVEALANALPPETIRFGCQLESVNVEKLSSKSVLQLHDGSVIKAKVLLGCDGANSVIAKFIGLKPTQPFSICAVRGMTSYPNGHGFAPEFLRIRKGKNLVGRIPIDEKTVYWFVVMRGLGKDAEIPKDAATIRHLALESAAGLSADIVEMIKNSESNAVSLTHLWYRAPWHLLSGNFRKETATVAGDAWHVMGPFLGQGGSSALEDAVVLARCLSKRLYSAGSNAHEGFPLSEEQVKEAIDEYLKERRMRVLHLSCLAYLRGLLLVEDTSFLLRFICIAIILTLFRDQVSHTRYDCGEL